MRPFDLRHALAVTGSALALAVPLALVGTLDAPRADTPVSGAQSGDGAPAVAAHDFPAMAVVRAVLGSDAQWGRALPVPTGCSPSTPVVSAIHSADGVTTGVFAMPTGAGRETFDQVASCASRSATVSGAQVAVLALDGGETALWARGDVLVSVTAARLPDLAGTDEVLRAALASAHCADLAPTAADARRNPARPDYEPYTVPHEIAVPSSGTRLATATDVAGTVEPVEAMAMPDGIQGPPEPQAPEQPGALAWPGEEPTARTVEVVTADTVGPGCGWAFNAASAPAADEAELARKADAAYAAARQALLAAQAEWVGKAEAFNLDYPAWAKKRDAWNAYALKVARVHESWASQATALDAYTALRAQWKTEVDARTAFLAEQSAAQATYNKALTACDEPAVEPTPTPTPSASPTPTPAPTSAQVCPPRRPAILDQEAPAVGPTPAAPDLWQPGDAR